MSGLKYQSVGSETTTTLTDGEFLTIAHVDDVNLTVPVPVGSCIFPVDGHRAIRDDVLGKFNTTALKTKEFTRLTALSGTIFTG